MDESQAIVIVPSEVEACLSGVSHVEIAADKTATLVYEDRSRICARLEVAPHALQANFLALVRSIQDVARANGQKLRSARIA